MLEKPWLKDGKRKCRREEKVKWRWATEVIKLEALMCFEAGTLSGSWRANGVGNDLMHKSNVGQWDSGHPFFFWWEKRRANRCLI